MGKFEGRIGLIPSSVFFYCLGFQIGVTNGQFLNLSNFFVSYLILLVETHRSGSLGSKKKLSME